MERANSASDWLKRWWWALAVAALTILVAVAAIFARTGDKESARAMDRTAGALKEARDKVAFDLSVHETAMEERAVELEEIRAISDEEERLRRLADFANRPR